jgi:RNA polymerase sigma-70 factor (ECF subfamily)
MILRAGDTLPSDESDRALETLCRAYWYPLYAYIRRLGHLPPDAQDLTQAFFAYLLEKHLVAKADPEIGHFRSFLLVALKGFMANEWRRERAQKRGGGVETLSFDAQTAENRYALEPIEVRDPAKLYEQAWAVDVLNEAVARLEAEFVSLGKEALFEELHVYLQGDRGLCTYAEVGAKFGMNEGAVKVAVLRMRRRCRELLRSVVADTVADPLAVDEDLRRLQTVLQS